MKKAAASTTRKAQMFHKFFSKATPHAGIIFGADARMVSNVVFPIQRRNRPMHNRERLMVIPRFITSRATQPKHRMMGSHSMMGSHRLLMHTITFMTRLINIIFLMGMIRTKDYNNTSVLIRKSPLLFHHIVPRRIIIIKGNTIQYLQSNQMFCGILLTPATWQNQNGTFAGITCAINAITAHIVLSFTFDFFLIWTGS